MADNMNNSAIKTMKTLAGLVPHISRSEASYRGEGHSMTQTIQVPVRITRVKRILSTRKHSSCVATTFTAVFADDSVKILTDKSWTLSGLIKPSEIGWQNWTLMSADDCPLYQCDWSQVPQDADWKKDYPLPLKYAAAR